MDVLLQTDKFCYLVDFLVLETHFMVYVKLKISLIFGRPSLITVNALINYINGLIMLLFGIITLEVSIFHIEKQLQEQGECYHT